MKKYVTFFLKRPFNLSHSANVDAGRSHTFNAVFLIFLFSE